MVYKKLSFVPSLFINITSKYKLKQWYLKLKSIEHLKIIHIKDLKCKHEYDDIILLLLNLKMINFLIALVLFMSKPIIYRSILIIMRCCLLYQ